MNRCINPSFGLAGLLAALLINLAPRADAQVPPAWEASGQFEYNVEEVYVDWDPATSRNVVTTVFSVTNPENNDLAWDILADDPFRQAAGLSRLALDIGWATTDYHNTGAANGEALAQKPYVTSATGIRSSIAPASPISIDLLRNAVPIGDTGRYIAVAPLPKQAAGTGVAAIEGHPAVQVLFNGTTTYAPVPVRSAFKYFPITDQTTVPRRQVVDIQKCQVCHTGQAHPETGEVIPRLTLHGANRTEELRVCVICHNPNQTDIAFRLSGAETSVDFKTMIHGIHGNKRRQNPLVIIGRNGSVNDFGHVEFPGNPRDCLKCHVEENGKGTFELPLKPGVLGTTVQTGSVPGQYVDVDPANNLRITPTAAVCSSCHDSDKAKRHIASARTGGSFSVLQSQIDNRRVVEKCANCHGPGKDKSVRKVHQ